MPVLREGGQLGAEAVNLRDVIMRGWEQGSWMMSHVHSSGG